MVKNKSVDIGGLINTKLTARITDDLTTNDATKVLSAKQGKELNERIGLIVDFFNGTGE